MCERGIYLLASIASSTLNGPSTGMRTPQQVTDNPKPGFHNRGPYNPAALLPPKLVKKIMDLEFVEMANTMDHLPTPGPGRPPLLAQTPIQDITTRVEKFFLMAALLATRFPEKALELWAYQVSIVRAERNFEVDVGSPTTGATDRRHSLLRTWTGQHQTSESTTRRSLVTPKPSPGALFASRRIIRHNHAHVTPAARGLVVTTTEGHIQHPSGPRAQSVECC